jgi:hypothetical protein
MPRTIQEIGPRDALLWLPFKDQYTDAAGKRVTRNYGQAPGAPATCQMGDGVTAGTFPAQIGGGKRGLTLDGGDYLQCGTAFAGATQFTLVAVARTLGATQTLASRRTAVPATHFWWYVGAAGLLTFTDGVNTRAGALDVRRQPLTTFAVVCTGTAVQSYVGGKIDGASGVVAVASQVVDMLIGARVPAAPADYFMGGINTFCGIPNALTPTQVSCLHNRLMREAPLP